MSKENINKAFRALRKVGYFAKQDHTCCQTCGWVEVPDEFAEKAVFYHHQDTENLHDHGNCFVAWSGDGEEIRRILNENKVRTDWNGKTNSRIRIYLN